MIDSFDVIIVIAIEVVFVDYLKQIGTIEIIVDHFVVSSDKIILVLVIVIVIKVLKVEVHDFCNSRVIKVGMIVLLNELDVKGNEVDVFCNFIKKVLQQSSTKIIVQSMLRYMENLIVVIVVVLVKESKSNY